MDKISLEGPCGFIVLKKEVQQNKYHLIERRQEYEHTLHCKEAPKAPDDVAQPTIDYMDEIAKLPLL